MSFIALAQECHDALILEDKEKQQYILTTSETLFAVLNRRINQFLLNDLIYVEMLVAIRAAISEPAIEHVEDLLRGFSGKKAVALSYALRHKFYDTLDSPGKGVFIDLTRICDIFDRTKGKLFSDKDHDKYADIFDIVSPYVDKLKVTTVAELLLINIYQSLRLLPINFTAEGQFDIGKEDSWGYHNFRLRRPGSGKIYMDEQLIHIRNLIDCMHGTKTLILDYFSLSSGIISINLR